MNSKQPKFMVMRAEGNGAAKNAKAAKWEKWGWDYHGLSWDDAKRLVCENLSLVGASASELDDTYDDALDAAQSLRYTPGSDAFVGVAGLDIGYWIVEI